MHAYTRGEVSVHTDFKTPKLAKSTLFAKHCFRNTKNDYIHTIHQTPFYKYPKWLDPHHFPHPFGVDLVKHQTNSFLQFNKF